MRATITCMKQLEYALEMQLNLKDNFPCKFSTWAAIIYWVSSILKSC